jgi:hypothetical protein
LLKCILSQPKDLNYLYFQISNWVFMINKMRNAHFFWRRHNLIDNLTVDTNLLSSVLSIGSVIWALKLKDHIWAAYLHYTSMILHYIYNVLPILCVTYSAYLLAPFLNTRWLWFEETCNKLCDTLLQLFENRIINW